MESRTELDAGERGHNSRRGRNAKPHAEQGKESSFDKELKHDAAIGGTDRLPKPYLVRTVSDRHKHDIDDADGAQSECNQADTPQKRIHGVENFADLVDSSNGVPFVE